jgi:hypothetical protein
MMQTHPPEIAHLPPDNGPNLGTPVGQSENDSRWRFTATAAIALCLGTLPFLWILWDLWTGTVNPLRNLSEANYYDVQARALLGGHLSVPRGSIGIEGFIRDSREYTYFSLFPSALRMPVLGLTHSLDGRLTPISMALAWATLCLFASLLLWRVRLLMRGNSTLGLPESACYGFLLITITSGSVLMFLAATPRVFQEELAWSAALTIGALFGFVGMLERPSLRRLALLAAMTLLVALTRGPNGYACIIACFLVAGKFAIDRSNSGSRRWAFPVLIAGLVPLGLMVALNLAKFGQVFGFSEADQVWTQLSAHRRLYLAANGGGAFGLQFLPSTLLAYLRPGALNFSGVFPFITLPHSPAPVIGHIIFDETDPTTSILASMPMLFILATWGSITAFRRRTVGQIALVRLPLLAALLCCGGVLVIGFIANRYLADFLPFLALGSMVGMVDLWRRIDLNRRAKQWTITTAIGLLAVFSVWANIGIAVTPTGDWTSAQARSFLSAQMSWSPGALRSSVVHSPTLPENAPSTSLFDIGNCSGIYISTSSGNPGVPGWQAEHISWLTIAQSPSFTHVLRVTLHRPVDLREPAIPILSHGGSRLVMVPVGPDQIRLALEPVPLPVAWPPPVSGVIKVTPGSPLVLRVTIDPNLDQIRVVGGGTSLGPDVAGTGETSLAPNVPDGAVTVTDITPAVAASTFCQQIAARP